MANFFLVNAPKMVVRSFSSIDWDKQHIVLAMPILSLVDTLGSVNKNRLSTVGGRYEIIPGIHP